MPYADPIKNKEFVKRWKEQNRDYLKAQAFKNYIKRHYGLTVETWESMKTSQSQKCLICGLEKKLVIDHCHKTNRVRGLLCFDCNIKLGQYEKFKCLIPAMRRYLGE